MVTPPRNTKYAPGSGTKPSVAASGVKGKITPISTTSTVVTASPENSRAMKEKSHRAPRRCYRSGVWTLHGTQTWRLDGHSLYSAPRLPGPRDFEADHRHI